MKEYKEMLQELFREHFPNQEVPEEIVTLWGHLGSTPVISYQLHQIVMRLEKINDN